MNGECALDGNLRRAVVDESGIFAALAALGFSDLEARIYCELSRSGAATGYGVAKAIGRPGANVYQALNAMQMKGSVLLADAASKAYRALPPDELLAKLERSFKARVETAEGALSALSAPPADDFLYQLSSADQALERARAMIGRAEVIILFDLFPGPFEMFKPLLSEARSRGVRVAGTVYDDIADPDFAGVAHAAPNGQAVRGAYPGAIMTFVADAKQYLETLLSEDGANLLNGIWTDSPYLACAKHSALSTEVRLNMLMRDHADPYPEISLMRSGAPGLQLLSRRRSVHGTQPGPAGP